MIKQSFFAIILLAGCTNNPVLPDQEPNHAAAFKFCDIQANKAYPPKFGSRKSNNPLVCRLTNSIRCTEQGSDFDFNDEPRQAYLTECFKLRLED